MNNKRFYVATMSALLAFTSISSADDHNTLKKESFNGVLVIEENTSQINDLYGNPASFSNTSEEGKSIFSKCGRATGNYCYVTGLVNEQRELQSIQVVYSSEEIIDVVKEATSKAKDSTLVFKGFRLFMNMVDAEALTLAYFIEHGYGFKYLRDDDDLLVLSDTEGNIKITSVPLENGVNAVVKLEFDRKAMDILFSSTNMPLKVLLQNFLDAYGISKLDAEVKTYSILGEVEGKQVIYSHRSGQGYLLAFYGDLTSGNLGQQLGLYMLGAKTPGSMELIAIKTEEEERKNFD